MENDSEWTHIVGNKNNDINIIDTNTLIPGQLIRIDETPTDKCWKMLPLFRDNAHGGTSVWQIGFSEDASELTIAHGTLITSKGQAGSIQIKTHPIKLNNSGRTLQQQGLLESRKKYMDKWKDAYKPAGDELPSDLNGCKPMLANKYDPPCIKNGKFVRSNIKQFPISTMPKIDGIRCLVRKVGPIVQTRSRLNNLWPHLHHIKEQLNNFFMYLPENVELDGEIYTRDIPFTVLTSIAKTFKNGLHKRHDELKYYIFDLIDPNRSVWEDRYAILVNALNKYREDGYENNTFIVLQCYSANSDKEIVDQHEKFVQEGYEGIMIRKYGCISSIKESQYRPNRSNNLLKYKHFLDEEATIIGGMPCEGTEEGAVRFMVKDVRGNEFLVRPRGSMELRRKWMIDISKLIGKLITIRYQELSEYGVPRFPVAICIRDYE
jgi:hypothetical protein